MADSGEEQINFARRAVVSRRLFFSHRIIRPLFLLSCLDLLVATIFAGMPDTRMTDGAMGESVFVAQAVIAWVNVVFSAGLIVLIYTTYSVTQRELTFERQS